MESTFALHRTVLNRISEFIINNSVLYYLSCCLLLLGAYSIMHSRWLSGAVLSNYCEIYAIFLVYVVLLAGLCLLVFRRLSMAEDGLVMAGLVLLLLLDPTSFNNLFYTYNLRIGAVIVSFGFVLSLALHTVLRKVGGIPWTKTLARTAVFRGFRLLPSTRAKCFLDGNGKTKIFLSAMVDASPVGNSL